MYSRAEMKGDTSYTREQIVGIAAPWKNFIPTSLLSRYLNSFLLLTVASRIFWTTLADKRYPASRSPLTFQINVTRFARPITRMTRYESLTGSFSRDRSEPSHLLFNDPPRDVHIWEKFFQMRLTAGIERRREGKYGRRPATSVIDSFLNASTSFGIARVNWRDQIDLEE